MYGKLPRCSFRDSGVAGHRGRLEDAFDTAYGIGFPKAAAQFEKHRHRLRHEPDAVESVIRTLVSLRSKHPHNQRIAQGLGYFRGNRHRMRYAEAKARGLPIGSDIVEAACKTLVTERLECSGRRRGARGGQAIPTLRSLVQSHRFEHAWSLLAQTYRIPVSCPDNAVPFTMWCPSAVRTFIETDQFRTYTRIGVPMHLRAYRRHAQTRA